MRARRLAAPTSRVSSTRFARQTGSSNSSESSIAGSSISWPDVVMVAVPIFPQLLLQMPIMPPVVPCGVTMAFEGAPVSETNSSKTVPVELFVTVILTCARAVEAPRIAQNARVKKRKRENEQSRAERKKVRQLK